MTLSICISTKDRPEALHNLLESIKKYTTDYELIIHDDSIGESIPVATAWNKCAEEAKGTYLVFLNDDMLVTEGWADSMIQFYESHPLVGSLAFKVMDDEGNIQSRGHSFKGLQPYLPAEDVYTVDYSDHPFVKRSTWKRVGGFTAHGHLYYEDADFGLKLQSYGLFNYYNPEAVLIHNTIGLRKGTDEDKRRRTFNENVIQQQSKESFYKAWGEYLTRRDYQPFSCDV